jgi:outer membrane protein assembly factor BamB
LFVLDATTGATIWTIGLYNGLPPVTVANGVVYVPQGSNLNGYDEHVGASLWSYPLAGSNSLVTQPVILNGVAYVGDDHGHVYAANTTTGAVEWQYTVGTAASVSSPAASNGILYFGAKDGYAYGMDAGTGNLIWRFQTNANFSQGLAVRVSHLAVSTSSVIARAAPGSNPTSQTVTVTNLGSANLRLREFTALPSWLTVHGTPQTGGVSPLPPGMSQDISLEFNMPSNPQSYTFTLTFADQSADNTPVQVPVTVVIGSQKTLYVSSANGLYFLDPTTGVRMLRLFTSGCTFSPVAIGTNGIVYTAACNTLYALNAATGAVVWSYLAGGSFTNNSSAPPVLANGLIYAAANDNYVYALNATTGAFAWKTNVGAQSQLAVGAGTVFASAGPPYTGFVTALDAATGTVKWTRTFNNLSIGAPVYADSEVFVSSSRWSCTSNPCNGLWALDAATGGIVWSVGLYNGLPPVAVANGIVYVPQGGNLSAFDESVGASLWSFSLTTTHSINTSPMVIGTTVYVTSDDGKLSAISTAGNTRSVVWQASAGTVQPTAPVIGNGIGNGAIFVGGGDPNAYAFDLTNGSFVWKSPLVSRTQLTPTFG